MNLVTGFAPALLAAATSPLGQAVAIILGTFVLEDATTVLAAMRVTDGALSGPLALAALCLGVAIGDLGLYGLGRLAARLGWLRRWIGEPRIRWGRAWLGDRLVSTVVATRFLPGTRLPTYTACGFLGLPFGRFAVAASGATLVWTSLLFGLSLELGAVADRYVATWRWPGGVMIALALVLVGRWIASRRQSAQAAAR